MAVGDVVNAIGSATGDFTYTPAAGVEVMVLSVLGSANGQAWLARVAAPAQSGRLYIQQGTIFQPIGLNVKMAINNTIYLQVNSNTYPAAFSGIQIK